MLVLSRKKGDAVIIDGDIRVKVIEVRGEMVRLGIEAPREVSVYRSEILQRIQAEAAREAACVTGMACVTEMGD